MWYDNDISNDRRLRTARYWKYFIDYRDVTRSERPLNKVFQNYLLFPHPSLKENGKFGLRFERSCSKSSKSAEQRVGDALKLI